MKATVPDKIIVAILQNLCPELSLILAKVFVTASWKKCFLNLWKLSAVCPVLRMLLSINFQGCIVPSDSWVTNMMNFARLTQLLMISRPLLLESLRQSLVALSPEQLLCTFQLLKSCHIEGCYSNFPTMASLEEFMQSFLKVTVNGQSS